MTNPRKEYLKQFCESELEKIFLDFAPRRLLDLYEPQVRIGPYRVDFAINKYRIVIECDSIQFHHKTVEQKKRDEKKTNYLTKKGWTLFRFSGHAIFANGIACHRMVADEITKYEPKIMDVKEFLSDNDEKYKRERFSKIDVITSATFKKEMKKFERREEIK